LKADTAIIMKASIIPLMPGETKGVLVFTFEDAAGKEHRIEKEFTVNAMEAAPVINPGIDFPGIDPGMGMGPGMPGTTRVQVSAYSCCNRWGGIGWNHNSCYCIKKTQEKKRVDA
jgi:hypothetical protein